MEFRVMCHGLSDLYDRFTFTLDVKHDWSDNWNSLFIQTARTSLSAFELLEKSAIEMQTNYLAFPLSGLLTYSEGPSITYVKAAEYLHQLISNYKRR